MNIRFAIVFFLINVCYFNILQAHPMPNSIVQIEVQDGRFLFNLKLPISELELAFGKDLSTNTRESFFKYKPELQQYLLQHIRLYDESKHQLSSKIVSMSIDSTTTELNGKYNEVQAVLEFENKQPLNQSSQFVLLYDAIIHQVVTHSAIVSVTQDWQNGIIHNNEKQIGIISIDTKSNSMQPFIINLEKGSDINGFRKIFWLGMSHIAKGTDHLLFLFVLLLPASLIAVKNRWANVGSKKYAFIRLLKIVTAFTIGHSLTLIIGALDILQIPAKPVEVIIAVSIVVTAVHCIKPIFYGKEIFIAAGFGLIHGLAFATVLSVLHLQTRQLLISILGFNLGIESMQLIVVIIMFPILFWLSYKKHYKYFKNVGSIAAILLSVYWIFERLS